MVKLVLTRGVPASGKSTWAKAWVEEFPNIRTRVNRDNLRWTLGIKTGVGTYEQEQEVTHWQDEMIRRALKQGRDVVVDNTNLRAKNVKDLLKIAREFDAEVEYKDFPIVRTVALQRDYDRFKKGERSVGPHVIDGFFEKFVKADGTLPPTPVLDEEVALAFKPYVPGRVQAMSFDLDGTLAHMDGNRGPYDATKYHLDVVDKHVRQLLWDARRNFYQIIILTGRNEDYREACEAWLKANDIRFDLMLMRPSDQPQVNDAIIKSDLVDKYISGVYDVVMHYDDRNRVVDALRAKGMKVSQVAPGDF